ncbi:response regulator [Leptospira sp. WS92.C1]
MNRKLLKIQLEGENFEVLSACDGYDALDCLKKTEIDVIISDILMPKMDGYRFCYQVRKVEKWNRIPFIFYTATYTSPSDEKLSFDLGADAFLKKPVQTKIILETIDQIFKNEQKTPKKVLKGFTDMDVLNEYSSRLVEKLEEKNHELIMRYGELEHEISERAKVEEDIIASEERFRQLTDAIREVFWMSSVDKTEMIYVSKSYEEIWGRSCKSLLDNPISWLDSIHPEDRDRMMEKTTKNQYSGEYNEEYRILRPDGSIRWIRDRAFPVLNSKNEVFRLAGIAEDITESKENERRLKENEYKRKELEKQLIQAQKLEGLGTLASGIAHDFNNILMIIMGHTSLLNQVRENPEKFSKSIDALQTASQRGASLVKQLLTFARKTEFQMELAQINSILREIKTMMEQTFPRNIQILSLLGEGLPSTLCDTNQIYQVLLNLCVNARDAMPKGGLLTIKTSVVNSENLESKHLQIRFKEYVKIEVIDTGIGMDETTSAKIFEPFFTTKGIGKGTGLGLSLVYSIIDNHQGFVDVHTALGFGTSFYVYLPVSESANVNKIISESSESEIHGGTEMILVVEDEDMIRDLLRTLLQSKGYRIVNARNGSEALALFKKYYKEISLIITDLGLPVLGGVELIQSSLMIKPDLKIILASGFIDPNVKSELVKNSAIRFIQKPYQTNELLAEIRSAIDR